MAKVICVFDSKTVGASYLKFTADLSGGVGGSFAGSLRRCYRLKQIRLIIGKRGLLINVPRAFKPERDLANLLEQNLDWILPRLKRWSANKNAPVELPAEINLQAVDELWQVMLADGDALDINLDARVINLPRNLIAANEGVKLLRRWLLDYAKEILPPMLLELADEFNFNVSRVLVKDLTSRWGSCSSKFNINLNSRLLLLPADLVRHIMLHELCHLITLNHSAEFYRQLNNLDPDCERHRLDLQSAWRLLPAWIN